MIIGNGLVAGALKDLSGWDNDILFSSGVSNSGDRDEKNYLRETDLVQTYLGKIIHPATFVYFSTLSIFDPSKKENSYVKHKRKIENIIRTSGVNFLILRLPNLVGISPNPNTLTNYFVNSIRRDKKIILNRLATRHLIDVADLPAIILEIKDRFDRNKLTVNVETDKPLTARQIVELIEEALNKKATIEVVNEDSDFTLKDNPFGDLAINYIWKTSEGYHQNLLKKYYSNG